MQDIASRQIFQEFSWATKFLKSFIGFVARGKTTAKAIAGLVIVLGDSSRTALNTVLLQ